VAPSWWRTGGTAEVIDEKIAATTVATAATTAATAAAR
jgi:hypothetical protein